MSSIDEEFVSFVVKSLVGKPDAVIIERRIDEKGVLLELTVDPEDLGRVIGKRGATAQSLRTLLRALGTKNEARYNLKIVDNGTGSNQSDDDSSTTPIVDNAVTTTASSDSSSETHQETTSEPSVARTETSDRVLQTRKELADLDDLDL